MSVITISIMVRVTRWRSFKKAPPSVSVPCQQRDCVQQDKQLYVLPGMCHQVSRLVGLPHLEECQTAWTREDSQTTSVIHIVSGNRPALMLFMAIFLVEILMAMVLIVFSTLGLGRGPWRGLRGCIRKVGVCFITMKVTAVLLFWWWFR